MAEMFSMKITGAAEVNKTLKRLPVELQSKVYLQAMRKGMNIMRDEAKQRAPVGRSFNKNFANVKKTKHKDVVKLTIIKLRDEIKVKVVQKTQYTYELALTIGRAFWGMFGEFGTSKQSKKPFMRPAYDTTKTTVLDTVGQEIGKGVERTAARLAGSLSKSGLVRR